MVCECVLALAGRGKITPESPAAWSRVWAGTLQLATREIPFLPGDLQAVREVPPTLSAVSAILLWHKSLSFLLSIEVVRIVLEIKRHGFKLLAQSPHCSLKQITRWCR